jgi:acyl-CoA thioesterase
MMKTHELAADLAIDTAVRPDDVVVGRYLADVPNHWDYFLPSGGVVMTAALRAAAAELAQPGSVLLSATSIFCRPVRPGRCVIDVVVLRRGRDVSQLRATMLIAKPLSSELEVAMEVTASFGADRAGPDVRGAHFPAVRSLDASLRTVPESNDSRHRGPIDASSENPYLRCRFFQQLQCRIAEGQAHWESFEAGPSRYARWCRFRAPQRDGRGMLDRLALPPLVDTMPTALHRAIGPGDYKFYAPSLDLTMQVIADTQCEWLLLRSTVERARVGYAVGSIELWDQDQQLIAIGSQSMYLQSIAGALPTIIAPAE